MHAYGVLRYTRQSRMAQSVTVALAVCHHETVRPHATHASERAAHPCDECAVDVNSSVGTAVNSSAMQRCTISLIDMGIHSMAAPGRQPHVKLPHASRPPMPVPVRRVAGAAV